MKNFTNNERLIKNGYLKFLSIFFIFFLLFAINNSVYSQCPTAPTSCAYTVSGSSNTNYNLNANETLCIQAGATYTGSISTNSNNAVIFVSSGAIFTPSSINNMQATLISCGNTTLPSLSLGSGTVIRNYGNMVFAGSLNFNGTVEIYNGSNSTMNFNIPSFTLAGNGTSLTNDGTITANELNTNQNTSLINNNTISASGNFNPNGLVNNYGVVKAVGFLNVNSTATINNYCSFVSEVGFNNNSPNTINDGLILILGTENTYLWQITL